MGAVYERSVDVRWRDTDALGHVNHVVFLTYLEEGRDAFYSQIIGSDPVYVVVRLEIDLRAEVRHQDRRGGGGDEGGGGGAARPHTPGDTLPPAQPQNSYERGPTPSPQCTNTPPTPHSN